MTFHNVYQGDDIQFTGHGHASRAEADSAAADLCPPLRRVGVLRAADRYELVATEKVKA
jgi:hypothetical protein